MREILEDASFNAEIAPTEGLEAVHAALTARGVEVTFEEMEAVLEEMAADVQEPAFDGELSEEELEAVAGGCAMWVIALMLGITLVMLMYYLQKHRNSTIAKKARALMG